MAMTTNKKSPTRYERGFTLIELIVTVMVLAILTTAALPSFRSFITNQRIKSASFDLMALITFTRSEALKRNADVTLSVIGSDPITVTTVVGGSTVTLKQQAGFKGIQLACATGGTCPGSIVYNGSGRMAASYGPMELHLLNTTDITSASFRCISIDMSGRPNSKKGPC